MNNKRCWLSLLLIIFCVPLLNAEEKTDPRAEYIRTHYAKFEYQVPMRDGVRLYTTVYTPYDTSKKHPILLFRTPYSTGPYGVDRYRKRLGPSEAFEKAGYIFVFQDVRGKFMSEGEYVNMRPQDAARRGKKATDDATDAWDTIDWLVKNVPNNNGKVGQWGISYPGYYTSVSAINSHPALKAISPQAPIADWFFDDFHRNGAFSLPMAFIFFDTFDKQRDGQFAYWPEGMKQTTPDGYDFFLKMGPHSVVNEKYFHGERPFWNQLTQHPNYDAFWKARNVLQHLKNVKPQVLVVGGWYDTEDLYGPLATYQTMSRNNRKKNIRLVMGPWSHGQWNRSDGSKMGEAEFGFNTSQWFQDNIQLPFFNHYLMDDQKAKLPAQVTVFETGANRFREFSVWPPKSTKAQKLYLEAGGRLSQHKPTQEASYSEYISDPAKPVPHTANVSRGWDKPYMTEDQRFAARRTDVLVFETQEAKKDYTITGPIKVRLWVSTDQEDADFIVKLVDVFPGVDENRNEVDKKKGNRHELIRWGNIRGRFRNSFEKPEAFKPNQPTLVSFDIYDVLHRIKRGHRLQIQVQSSFFPFLDRNPQNWVDNIFAAKAEDYVKALHRIYHQQNNPSVIEFSVMQ